MTIIARTATLVLLITSTTLVAGCTNDAPQVSAQSALVTVQAEIEPVRSYPPAVAAVPVVVPLIDDYSTVEGIMAIAGRVLRSIGEDDVVVTGYDPAVGSHLAGVWPGDTTTILLGGARLVREPEKVESVVLHEAMHIRQNRLGMALDENVADCAAIALGATWTWYTASCDSYADQVAALLEG